MGLSSLFFIVAVEILVLVVILLGFKYERQIIRVEHAFVKTVIWTAYEIVHRQTIENVEDVPWLRK